MSHINVASTKALLGTYFGNIDAGNWSLAKEQLVSVLDGADHLVPLRTASIVPAMLRLADFTKAGVVDTVGWYNHQQSHADATAKSATIAKTAKAHLRMCVGQATYDMVKELPVHEPWAKLESSFTATSSTVDRSAKLVELINMQPFVAGDDFEVWIATFNTSVKGAQQRGQARQICEYVYDLFLSIHVDDGLLTGDGDLDGFIQQLKSRFETKSSDGATVFLGQRIMRDGKTGAAIVHQPHFISSILEDHDMAGCSPRPTPVSLYKSHSRKDSAFDASTKPYRAIVGKLLFLSGTTRPDIAFAASKVASHCNNFSQTAWEALMHILRYLQGTRDVELLSRKSEGSPLFNGFVNAGHGADPETRRSVTGFVFLCTGGAVTWMSKRQALVTVSSTEAELHGDNQWAIRLAKDPAFHARTKHIGIHFHFIRDHIAEGTIEMVWIPTNTMAADVLTKGLASREHWDFEHAMGLVDASREGAS